MTDLEWLARNVSEWPSYALAVFVQTRPRTPIWLTPQEVEEDTPCIFRNQWQAKRERLGLNEPGFLFDGISVYCHNIDQPVPTAGTKHDHEKPQLDLLPPLAILEMGHVLTFGAHKYAPDNWRTVPDARRRYTAALLRHALAYLGGETLDAETQRHHMASVMCCAAFIIELEEQSQ